MNQFRKNKPHGPWESYYIGTNNLFYRGNYNKGEKIGYWIFFERNREVTGKSFYL